MSAEEEALAPGTVFAGYQVIRQLGEGAFGKVYEAVRDDISLTVALKVLRAEVSDNDEVATRFLREAQAVAQLRHPNIVGYVELGEVGGKAFLAMELLRGEALTDLMLREGHISLQRALDIAIPLIAAVRTVHAQGIVHRDLKPDNVFLTYTESGAVVPKILDFGFAKISAPGMQITRADTAIGTPNFMSPEQMLSPREVDPRSDQWALGVLLYYMLTGVKPFAAPTLGDTLKNVLQRDPPTLREYLPALPEQIDVAVMRTLRKSPGDRLGSVHELAEALLPYASDDVAALYTAEAYGDSVWDDMVDTDPGLSAHADPSPPAAQRNEHLAPPPSYDAPYNAPYEPDFAHAFKPDAPQPLPSQPPQAGFDPSLPYAPTESVSYDRARFDPSVPYAPAPVVEQPPPPPSYAPAPQDPYALSSTSSYLNAPQPAPYVFSPESQPPAAPHSLQPMSAQRAPEAGRGRSGAFVAIAGAVVVAVAAVGAASLWAVRQQPETPRFASPTAAPVVDAAADGGDASAQR